MEQEEKQLLKKRILERMCCFARGGNPIGIGEKRNNKIIYLMNGKQEEIKKFEPTLGDRMIFRQMVEETFKDYPEIFDSKDDLRGNIAFKIRYYYYRPLYQASIKRLEDEGNL